MVAATVAGGPLLAHADDGTWSVDGSGNWSDPAKWTGGNVATGMNAAADFSTVDLAVDRVVTNDVPGWTIGHLRFADNAVNGTSTRSWTLDGAGKTLVLSTGGAGMPSIANGARSANAGDSTIVSTVLAGTEGLEIRRLASPFNYTRPVNLMLTNTYTGTTTVRSNGWLQLSDDRAAATRMGAE
jgi:hypothetical protein